MSGHKLTRGDDGVAAVMMVLFATVVAILLAFVIDGGRVLTQHQGDQNGADAAALAAATSCGGFGVPGTLTQYVTSGTPATSGCNVPSTRQVQVTVTQPVDYKLVNGTQPTARPAIAQWGQLGAGGIFPFTFSACAIPDTFTYGTATTPGTLMLLHGQATRTSCPRDGNTTGQHVSSKGFVQDGCALKSFNATITDALGNNFGGTGCDSVRLGGCAALDVVCNMNYYVGKDVLVPIWGSGNGASTTIYTLTSLAYFHILGWSGNGNDHGGQMNIHCAPTGPFVTVPGNDSKPCLYGYMIDLGSSGPLINAPCGFGTVSACAVKLIK